MNSSVTTLLISTLLILSPTPVISESLNCKKAISTIDINTCAFHSLKKSELKLETYFKASKKKLSQDLKTLTLLEKS